MADNIADHVTTARELVQRMRAAPPFSDSQHKTVWDKIKADVAAWEQSVTKKLTAAQQHKFQATRAGEADWVNYTDLVHNDKKKLAADLDKRADFLSHSVLK